MIEILRTRAVINVKGSDALKFLQNLTTNDLYQNNYSYNYMLSSNGRYLFDFFVFKERDDNLFIDINTFQAPLFIKRLEMYRLRAKIEILNLSEEYMISYSSDKLENTLFSLKDPRFQKLGFRSLIKKTDIEDQTAELYLKDKFQFAIPDGYEDLIFEKSIPIEYGAEELRAISYTKGCYIGQELISRTKYQGEVRKKIFKIISESDFPSKELEVISNGENIGILCSYYKNLAIALIREEKYLKMEQKKVTISGIIGEIIIPEWRR